MQESEPRVEETEATSAGTQTHNKGTRRELAGKAQASDELQRGSKDIRRQRRRVEEAESAVRGREQHAEEAGTWGADLLALVLFQQPAVLPDAKVEMQERAWARISGEVRG